MMPTWNVHIHAFDDPDFCEAAIRTVPTDVDVHVCDGRYVDFAGERDLTPELEDICEEYGNAHYHAPSEDRLPFGHDSDAHARLRAPIYEKAKWVNYEILPQDEWTLKLDTDEQLITVDEDWLEEDADPSVKYAPAINRPDDPNGRPHITRLWQPSYWTVWIDDCLLPRDLFPRDMDLEYLHRGYTTPAYRPLGFAHRKETTAILIENGGQERPEEYQERRLEHLEHIGRDDRARELREYLYDERF